ncbi:MAG: DUF4832 domain-containing protein [Lachnospiraceae bacterium]|nr:DUF4832 domain-containing protein [Lachnospiraceae bacterium]
MIKLLKSIKKYKGYKPARIEESTKILINPCRGWFVLKTFNLAEELLFKDKGDEENLILLLIDIGIRRENKLSEEDISKIEMIIDRYHDMGYDIILRVCYDSKGKGLEAEPSSFRQVHEHTEQIAELVKRYHEKIFLYQGLLVGSWGEMHSTKYASIERLSELNDIFEKGTGNLVYRAVRKPVQWRWLREQPDIGKRIETGKLGIFNDGMFGSDSDLGTFDSQNKDNTHWVKAWNRENELNLISDIASDVPYGGEALFGEGFSANHSLDDYVRELARQKVTYLNKHHDKKLIEWFRKETVTGKGIWNGVSYYDYIGNLLGYRFIIKKAGVYKESDGFYIEITIENAGFAGIYIDAEIVAILEGKDSSAATVFEDGLRCCLPRETREFKTGIIHGSGRVYVSARQIIGKKQIYFANQTSDKDGRIYIGEIV